MGETPRSAWWFVAPNVDICCGTRYPLGVMNVFVEDLDPQQRFDEKERDCRADLEALRSGRKSEAQLKRENEVFAFPRESIRLRLDLAKSLH